MRILVRVSCSLSPSSVSSLPAFDLFEHARKIDPRAAEVYFYQSLYYTQLKKDSLALECMNKAIALNPDNLTYAERLAQYYIGMGHQKPLFP